MDYGVIDAEDILHIQDFLMQKHEIILKFNKFIFFAVLSFGRSLTSQSVKCISLQKEPFLARSTISDLNTNELRY